MNTVTAAYPVEDYPLHPDEPCYRLVELNLIPPDGREWRRYQLVQVARNDRKMWVRIDMGLAADNPFQEFRIVADGDEDTVGYVQGIADQKRADDYWARFLAEQPKTLITDFLDTEEESIRIRHNQSTFGPAGMAQRNGFQRRSA